VNHRNGATSPIVIDRMSSARRLTTEELGAWAADQRIFISSVMGELAAERRTLADVIRELGATPILFEEFGGRDESARDAFLDGVIRCDIYLGVVADRYGSRTSTGRSATHEEYREAERLGKRVAVWVKADGSERQGDTCDFVEEVRAFHTTGSFMSAEELIADVRRRLHVLAAEDLAPWVKLGPVVFRAELVCDAGDRVELHARVRDPRIGEALVGLRSDQWGRGAATRFTNHLTSRPVVVASVIVTTTSRSFQDVTIELGPDPTAHDQGYLGQVTIQGVPPEDQVEHALRHRLLGERMPAELRDWPSLAPQVSLAPIEELVADVAGPVAQLLLVEALVGAGRALLH
jgi:hypothetical protein